MKFDEQMNNPKPICPVNIFEVGGIIKCKYGERTVKTLHLPSLI